MLNTSQYVSKETRTSNYTDTIKYYNYKFVSAKHYGTFTLKSFFKNTLYRSTLVNPP